jgi:hypothetical protein
VGRAAVASIGTTLLCTDARARLDFKQEVAMRFVRWVQMTPWLVVSVVALVAALGGLAFADQGIPGADGAIHAC